MSTSATVCHECGTPFDVCFAPNRPPCCGQCRHTGGRRKPAPAKGVIAASVPKHLHRITFGAKGLWGVRAFCGGCGWQTGATSPSDSDAVYWKAREHLATSAGDNHAEP